MIKSYFEFINENFIFIKPKNLDIHIEDDETELFIKYSFQFDNYKFHCDIFYIYDQQAIEIRFGTEEQQYELIGLNKPYSLFQNLAYCFKHFLDYLIKEKIIEDIFYLKWKVDDNKKGNQRMNIYLNLLNKLLNELNIEIIEKELYGDNNQYVYFELKLKN